MTEREGVEIDYCPTCRGVWLDRGEIDKIIERSTARSDQHQPPPREHDRREVRSDEHGRHDEYGTYRQPKKKDRLSFLGDLLGGGD
jgi:Zn-finger nucleic acid-binding protein